MLTSDEIAAARAIIAKATPDMQACRYVNEDGTISNLGDMIKAFKQSGELSPLSEFYGVTKIGTDKVVVCYSGNGPTSRANSIFIAAARTGWPAALDALEAERAARVKAEQERDELQERQAQAQFVKGKEVKP